MNIHGELDFPERVGTTLQWRCSGGKILASAFLLDKEEIVRFCS